MTSHRRPLSRRAQAAARELARRGRRGEGGVLARAAGTLYPGPDPEPPNAVAPGPGPGTPAPGRAPAAPPDEGGAVNPAATDAELEQLRAELQRELERLAGGGRPSGAAGPPDPD